MTNTNINKCSVTGSTYDENSFSDKVHKYIKSLNSEQLEYNFKKFTDNEDLFKWFSGLVWELQIHSDANSKDLHKKFVDKGYEPEEYSLMYRMWDIIGQYLLQDPRYFSFVFELYKKLLGVARNVQKPNNRFNFFRIHKGGIYHNLAISKLNDDKELSKVLFFLAFIEDFISDRDNCRNTPAYKNLKLLNALSDGEEEIKSLKKIVDDLNRKQANFELSNPELIFLKLIGQSNTNLKLKQTLNWDNIFCKKLFEEALKEQNKNLKGSYFEMLASYLFITSQGFDLSNNTHSLHSENDIRVRNLITDDPLLELLGRYILVECKNLSKKISSTIVKKFASNVRFANCDVGILFSKEPLTGKQGNSDAWYVVRMSYHRDNIILIAISNSDIKDLYDEKTSLRELLKTKYEDIRFDQ